MSVWVEIFRDHAVTNAEAEEKAAQQAAVIKWTDWIHDGPASGLRRQHQFSRGTQGWTPTRKCLSEVQPIDAEDEMDHVEGLSREELDAVKVDQVGGNPPANAQQQVDDEAEAWMGQWGKGTRVEPLIWPSDMRDELAQILREELIEASDTFPNHTGLGWDRLHPKAIGRLANETVDLLVRVLLIRE